VADGAEISKIRKLKILLFDDERKMIRLKYPRREYAGIAKQRASVLEGKRISRNKPFVGLCQEVGDSELENSYFFDTN
jgi:hypothetical protein